MSPEDAFTALNPDALIVTDMAGHVVHWNEGATSVFGFAASEAIGRILDDLIIPAAKASEQRALLAQLRRDGSVRSESVGRRKNGLLIHVDVLGRHVDLAGEGYFLWSTRDVTQPKVMREARQLEARFGELLESTPDAMLALDETGHILMVNANAECLFGYGRDDLTGHSVEDLLPARFRDDHVRHRTGYFGQPRVRSMGAGLQLFGLHRNGEEFPVEVSLSPLRTDAGMVVMSAVRDMTDHLRAAQKFRGLLEAAPDAIVIVDADGKIVLANSQADNLFGYSRDELIEQAVELLLPEGLRAVHARHRAGFFSQPRVRAMGAGLDLHARAKDGREFPVEISLSPLVTETGTLVSAAIRDISERKRVERQLQEQNLQLASANQAKSQFLASMSHELRTPLNAIIGFTGTLLMQLPGPLNEEQDKQLRAVQQAGLHLLALINDLLDLTRIEAGRAEINLVRTDGHELATSAVYELRPIAEAKGLQLDLESSGTQLFVMADRRILLQILLNLLGNALKYTDTGRVCMQLSRSTSASGSIVSFNVIDTGIGIAPQDHERLFKAFSQVGQPDRPTEGAGLGLYLSAKLAEVLRGSMSFTSEPGSGSVFTLSLPGV
jgi:PAS domain S-box-containing protein